MALDNESPSPPAVHDGSRVTATAAAEIQNCIGYDRAYRYMCFKYGTGCIENECAKHVRQTRKSQLRNEGLTRQTRRWYDAKGPDLLRGTAAERDLV